MLNLFAGSGQRLPPREDEKEKGDVERLRWNPDDGKLNSICKRLRLIVEIINLFTFISSSCSCLLLFISSISCWRYGGGEEVSTGVQGTPEFLVFLIHCAVLLFTLLVTSSSEINIKYFKNKNLLVFSLLSAPSSWRGRRTKSCKMLGTFVLLRC